MGRGGAGREVLLALDFAPLQVSKDRGTAGSFKTMDSQGGSEECGTQHTLKTSLPSGDPFASPRILIPVTEKGTLVQDQAW